MKTIAKPVQCEINVKKSQFICSLFPTKTKKESNEIIQKLNEQALAENIISVCSVGGETAKAFLVRGSTVYQYTVNADLTFSITSTGFNGKKVKSNPDVNSHIIIVDFNGNARLVTV